MKQYPHFVHVGLAGSLGKLVDKALKMQRPNVRKLHVHQIIREFPGKQL